MKIQSWLKHPWLIVMLGIVFNVAAALISDAFIRDNEDEAVEIRARLVAFDRRIDNAWEIRTEVERKRDVLLTGLLFGRAVAAPNAGADYLNAYLERIARDFDADVKHLNLSATPAQMLAAFDRLQAHIGNFIDDLYVERSGVETALEPIAARNNRLRVLAFSMQILGLILILSAEFMRSRRAPAGARSR